jgi:hypothetical protein
MGLSYNPPGQPATVPYMDLGGGLNTRLDPHALQRNELAISINLWSSYDNAIAKRPGTVPLVTPGGVVNNNPGPCKSLLAMRWNSVTYLVYVGHEGHAFIAENRESGIGLLWRHIGNFAASAKFVTCAQMFSPGEQMQMTFFADGVNTPKKLGNPLTDMLSDVATGPGKLPTKYGQGANGTPITPQFVKTVGNNSLLFYTGEPSNRSAVYISDPFYPQDFTTAAQMVSTDPNSVYNPAIIGNNDGVEGGPINGWETLGSGMVIFKEAATYVMVQTTLLGEDPCWQVVQVSTSTGCVAPRSVVQFDSFIIFLAIDGVYLCDGTTVQQISADVGPIFDSTLNGFPATITNREIARAVRHGMRYELWYSTGEADHCNQGIWFDFTKQSRFGNPICGLIEGMTPGGLAELRGPKDDGNVAWGDALVNRVGKFGRGYADFDQPIATAMAGKADLFDDVFGPEACIGEKQMQDAYAIIECVDTGGVQVDFFGQVIVNIGRALGRVLAQPIESDMQAGIWGYGSWGEMLWGTQAGSDLVVVKIPMQNGARGHTLQVAIKEKSAIPWVMMGYCAYVNFQKVGY